MNNRIVPSFFFTNRTDAPHDKKVKANEPFIKEL